MLQPTLQQQRSSAARNGLIILTGCALILAGIIALLVIHRPPKRELATGCIADAKLNTQHVVIVDKTDPWSEMQARLLRAALLRLARDLASEDRLTLIAFDGRAERPPTTLFDRCKPALCTSIKIVVCTPSVVEAAFRLGFADPLSETLTAITTPSNAPATHLVAFLSNVAAHLKYEARARSLRIAIYSDMAEHNANISIYANPRAFTPAAFTRYFNETVRDRLKNITLTINVVPTSTSTPAVQRRLKEAWQAALAANAISYSWQEL